MKMATLDGRLDLRELEPLAAAGFDKRALTTRWPTMTSTSTYTEFLAAAVHRLGIGANGDGAKALRLLARIQAGQQSPHRRRAVQGDGARDSPRPMPPPNKAVEHFGDLEGTYQRDVTAADKARTSRGCRSCGPNASRRCDRRAAHRHLRGATATAPRRSCVWQLRTESQLLEQRCRVTNRAERRNVPRCDCARRSDARANSSLASTEIANSSATHGGDILERLGAGDRTARRRHDRTAARRITFRRAGHAARANRNHRRTVHQRSGNRREVHAGFDDARPASCEDRSKSASRERAWPAGEPPRGDRRANSRRCAGAAGLVPRAAA